MQKQNEEATASVLREGDVMKANLKAIQRRKKEEADREHATKIWIMAQLDAYLRLFYALRFNKKTRFKKRLEVFINDFCKETKQLAELDKDDVKVAVMLKDLKESGVDLTEYFEDLLKFEEAKYEITKTQEQGKRCAGK